jgi:uncharacterized membrane protein
MFKLLLFLHVISAIVAFGPTLAFPLFTRAAPRTSAAQVVTALQRLTLPGLIGLVVFGGGAVGASSGDSSSNGKEFDFSQAWISVAFLLVIAALALVWFVLIPAQRKVVQARSDGEAETLAKKASGLMGAMHLILVVALIMMVWQPGS